LAFGRPVRNTMTRILVAAVFFSALDTSIAYSLLHRAPQAPSSTMRSISMVEEMRPTPMPRKLGSSVAEQEDVPFFSVRESELPEDPTVTCWVSAESVEDDAASYTCVNVHHLFQDFGDMRPEAAHAEDSY